MVEVETITDGGEALQACADLFRVDPVGSNMVAGVLRPGVATHLHRVHDGDRTLGAIVDWPSGWTLSRLHDGAHEALEDCLPEEGGRLSGSALDVFTISRRWTERTGGSVELDELMRMYRLSDLMDADSDGELAAVQPDDAAAITHAARWARRFGEDIGHERDDDHSAAVAQMQRAADEHRLHVWWHEGETVAQLLIAPERFGVVRIGGVYTPPEHRRRGHASDLTAAISAELLRRPAVHDVTLLTQATNASTNRLYRRIGFSYVDDVLSVDLCSR